MLIAEIIQIPASKSPRTQGASTGELFARQMRAAIRRGIEDRQIKKTHWLGRYWHSPSPRMIYNPDSFNRTVVRCYGDGGSMAKSPQTVIGIPGRWPNRSDIVTSIASRSGGYLFAGMVMMKIGTKDGFTLEIYDRDPNLKNAFSIAGRGRLTDEDLDAIDSHTFTLYVVADGGSVDAAKRLMHAANGLVKAGGLAVKVESTGVAHRADQWAEFCSHDHLVNLLQAYVTYIGGNGVYYSCGMHNLGHPDALVEAGIPPNDAAKLLHTFASYMLVEPKVEEPRDLQR
jgi:hypothetical protein